MHAAAGVGQRAKNLVEFAPAGLAPEVVGRHIDGGLAQLLAADDGVHFLVQRVEIRRVLADEHRRKMLCQHRKLHRSGG